MSTEELKDNNITKNILGFDLEIIEIENFKEYYESNLGSFSSFSEKAFLKAVKIPPQYFLEQPKDTREELLCNKYDVISRKLAGKYIAILKKDNRILNCVRVELNELEDLHERISLNEDIIKKLTLIKDFIKDGYSSNFIPSSDLKEGEYNLGIFIDYPLMLNKLPIVNIGFYYCPKKGEDNCKNIYVQNELVDFNDYQNLDMLLEDILNIKINEVKEEKIIETLKDKLLLKEIDEILIKLKGKKVIPKSYVNKISKHVSKNELQLPNVFSFLELMVSYEPNFHPNDNYKQVSKLRNIMYDITTIIEKVDKDAS